MVLVGYLKCKMMTLVLFSFCAHFVHTTKSTVTIIITTKYLRKYKKDFKNEKKIAKKVHIIEQNNISSTKAGPHCGPALVELMLFCSIKRHCSLASCKCVKAQLPCTSLCLCLKSAETTVNSA